VLAALAAIAILAPSAVSGVAVDGGRVAYADAGCTVRIRSSGGATRLGRTLCTERTSTGSGLAGLALAGNRALWVTYTGGNVREWSVWTASTTRPAPRRLRFVAGDVDAPARVVAGDGDGDLLPYAVDRDVVVLRASGARRFAWRAPARVTAVDAAGREVAVASADGLVTILDAGGRVRREERFDGEIAAVHLAGRYLVVQQGGRLEVRGGRGVLLVGLRDGARLVGAAGRHALLVVRGRLVRIDLDSLRDARVDGTKIVSAAGRRVTVR
jgi:hypothetical protein